MTNTELEVIVTNIAQWHANHLFREALPHSIKELRSIEIAALREALEVVEKAEKVYDFEGVPIRNPAAYDLETTIRTIELPRRPWRYFSRSTASTSGR